jgi:hypothetical protein
MEALIVKTTEEWIVNTEEEAKALIEKAKTEGGYELIKYSSDKKEKKSKGEVIDTWYLVKLTKKF